MRKCGKNRPNNKRNRLVRRFVIITIALSGCSQGPWQDGLGIQRSAAIPGDVREFIIERQSCEHFAGEEGYDAERAAFLQKQTDKLCTGTDKKLYDLRVKYQNNEPAKKALADFEDCIEYSQECISKIE